MIHAQPSSNAFFPASHPLRRFASRLVLQIEPPQPPLPPLVSRFAYYLQLPDVLRCHGSVHSPAAAVVPKLSSHRRVPASLRRSPRLPLPDAAPVVPIAHVSTRGDITPTLATSHPGCLLFTPADSRCSFCEMVHAAAMSVSPAPRLYFPARRVAPGHWLPLGLTVFFFCCRLFDQRARRRA